MASRLSLESEQVLPGPSITQPTPLIDVLLRIRRDLQQGRLFIHIGDTNVERLVGFIVGYQACLGDNNIPDAEFSRFSEWLRVVKGEFPGEGWAAQYLRDCHGDHLAAIQKYLDFVAEFASTQRTA